MNSRHIMTPAAKTTHSRGALPWPEFLDQCRRGPEPKAPRFVPVATQAMVRQAEITDAKILRCIKKGYDTVRKIGIRLNMNHSKVRDSCNRLAAKGLARSVRRELNSMSWEVV